MVRDGTRWDVGSWVLPDIAMDRSLIEKGLHERRNTMAARNPAPNHGAVPPKKTWTITVVEEHPWELGY